MTWWLIPLGLVTMAILFVMIGILADELDDRRLERLQAEQQADMEPRSCPDSSLLAWGEHLLDSEKYVAVDRLGINDERLP
jgi:hypothetical protein